MTDALVKTRIRGGVWEGVMTAAAQPDLRVTHQGTDIGEPSVTPHPDQAGSWVVRVDIPAQALGEGVQTFLIEDRDRGEAVAQFQVLAGEPLDADLRAEVTLLRAELDLLKQAFRRHCLDTG